MSADQQYVLLVHDIQKIFHYSYTAKYKIYNVSNEHVFGLEGPNGSQDLQLAEWGPKGSQMVSFNPLQYNNASLKCPPSII